MVQSTIRRAARLSRRSAPPYAVPSYYPPRRMPRCTQRQQSLMKCCPAEKRHEIQNPIPPPKRIETVTNHCTSNLHRIFRPQTHRNSICLTCEKRQIHGGFQRAYFIHHKKSRLKGRLSSHSKILEMLFSFAVIGFAIRQTVRTAVNDFGHADDIIIVAIFVDISGSPVPCGQFKADFRF